MDAEATSITLTDEQLKVLGADYNNQLHSEFAADQYNSTFLKRKNNSTVNLLEPVQKRQNALLPVALLFLADPVFPVPAAPLLPVSPLPDIPLLPVAPLLPVSPVLPAIGEYTRLGFMFKFTRSKEATDTPLRVSDTTQTTPDQGLCGLPTKAYNLHAVDFHPKVNKYTMNFSVPGQDSKITELISTSELLQFPNGKEAIQVYADLHKPKKFPVAPPSTPIDLAVYFFF